MERYLASKNQISQLIFFEENSFMLFYLKLTNKSILTLSHNKNVCGSIKKKFTQNI